MVSRPGPLPSGSGWSFEVKWDGFRAVISTEGGLRIRSRRFEVPARGKGRRAMGQRVLVQLTAAERGRYQRWWIEQSGLSRAELINIAIGLGGDYPYRADLACASGRRLLPASTQIAHDAKRDLAA